MSIEGSAAYTTREAPLSLMKALFLAPAALPICCVCGLIRDEGRSSLHPARWVTPQIYRQTYELDPDDFPLTHTYCLTCFVKAQETVKQYFRKIETAA